MQYIDVLNRFKTILDRDDMTDAQARIFMSDAMTRVTRDLRLPSMERALLITPTASAMVQFPVPADLIQIIDVLVPVEYSQVGQMRPLKRVAYRFLMGRDNTDIPRVYARFQQQIYLAGALPVGTQLQFLYYGNFSTFASDTDTNELTATMGDIAVYAALKYGGDFFEHPLTASWETTYQSLKAAVVAMAIDLEMEGGLAEIEPTYADSCEY